MKLKPAHEKALRATLRVTLFAALGACGGGGAATGAAGGGGGAPMNRPTTNTAAVAERAPKPATEAECRAALAEAYPNGDPKFYNPNEPTPRAPTTVSDADLRACCEGLKSTASYEDYRQLGCCAQAFESGHCTPWGPPTPPAMRAVA